MTYSNKYLQFNVRLLYLLPFFRDNQERFGFTDKQMELLEELFEKWQDIYGKYTNPATNFVATGDIVDLYPKIYNLVNSMKQRTKGPLIKLSGLEKVILEVNTNTKKAGRIPVTDYAPTLTHIESTINSIKIYAMNPKNLGSKQKPQGAGKLGVLVCYTEPNAPSPNIEEYKRINDEKKTIFEIEVTPATAGMTLYIIVYYISPTGEEGKRSTPLIVKVPGVRQEKNQAPSSWHGEEDEITPI